jgi:hypothetical protein
MKDNKKKLNDELKQAEIKIKEYEVIIREMNKKLKLVQKGELSINEIKSFFEP